MSSSLQKLSLLAAVVVGAAALAVVPVSAHETENHATMPKVSRTAVAELETKDDSTSSSSRDDKTTPTGEVNELKERASKLLAEKRSSKATHSADARLKACQARETKLNKKIANYGKHADKQLVRLDGVYDKLQAYQADKKLDAAEYDTLVTVADTKQTTATAAVAALKAVTVDIDCASADPAASVATVKTAVASARTALQEYHLAVKNVLVELMTSKSDSSDTATETPKEDTTDAQ